MIFINENNLKKASSGINESNTEISTVVGAVVIDTHQPIQTEKRYLW